MVLKEDTRGKIILWNLIFTRCCNSYNKLKNNDFHTKYENIKQHNDKFISITIINGTTVLTHGHLELMVAWN